MIPIESKPPGGEKMKRLALRTAETLRTTAALFDCGGSRERPAPPPIVLREAGLDHSLQPAAKLLEFDVERRGVAS
jgi:hypothetical protein